MFDKAEKNNKDALIEVVNLTALSNGEIEEIMIKRTGKDRIPIITVHQANGFKFDYVFLAGLEENTFPTYQSVKKGVLNEEERKRYIYQVVQKTNWERNYILADLCNISRIILVLFIFMINSNSKLSRNYGIEFIN